MSAITAALDSKTHDESGAHIPRPPNAFLLFRKYHARTATRGSGNPPLGSKEKISEDSKTAAGKWKSMSVEEKAPWFELQAERKREHQEKYPNYQFTPGPAKPRIPRGRKDKSFDDATGVNSLGDGWEIVKTPVPEPLKDETASEASCGDSHMLVDEGNVESQSESGDSDSGASESSSSSDVDNPLATARATSGFQSPLTPFLLESSLKRNRSFHEADQFRSPHARFNMQCSRFRKEA